MIGGKFIVALRGDRLFYLGDVASCAVCHVLFNDSPDVKEMRVMRSNAPILHNEKADISIGFGGLYDPAKFRFDHNADNVPRRPIENMPYGSFGLVWRHLGEHFIKKIVKDPLIDKLWSNLFLAVDQQFILPSIDIPDLRREKLEEDDSYLSAAIEERSIEMSLYEFMYCLNPPLFATKEDVASAFVRAVEVFKEGFVNLVNRRYSLLRHKRAVYEAYTADLRKAKPHLLYLPAAAAWETTLLDELNDTEVQFVIVKEDKIYRIYAVPAFGETTHRALFPEEWRSKSQTQLQEMLGLPDSVYAHPEGTMAGAYSLEGAIMMAERALWSEKFGDNIFTAHVEKSDEVASTTAAPTEVPLLEHKPSAETTVSAEAEPLPQKETTLQVA